ncbi:MAG: Replicative DNA helicase [Candidatus Gottesmanbacteria bacterium GW2011_GWB1_49_7]|uniref:Replicative DNA helicase n=1 Tax=Candidatus Gottesmanbacteria bacterium GW2011_GWB1_49_7 TaxID=1618448 RepID=A0A0G1W3C6_9BACT|nr:MAG: Replicative DNA helicase [Candidatus Gottesmanbacteria bacterium GW2011_GWB1_49_7]
MSRMDLTAEFLTYLAKNPEGRIIAREAGVSHEWFLDPIHKKIWGIIGASEDSLSDVYIRAQGGVDFYSVDYTEDLAKLIESFREATRKEELVTACGKASMAADSQSKLADDILRELHQALQGMERFRCPDQQSPLFLKDLQIVYQDYLKRREAGGITGLPYPFPTLSRLTTGLNPAEWVVFYGHAKAMKTWIWLYSALYMWRTNNVPLLITSKEMSAKVCRERFCAVYAGVDYDRFRRGDLLKPEDERLQLALEEVDEKGKNAPIYWKETDKMGIDAVNEVQSWANDFKVSAIFFDCVEGLTFDYKDLPPVARGIKNTAKTYGIPWVGTTQANRVLDRKKPKSDPEQDMGGSIRFVQTVDQLFRLVKVKPAQLQLTMAAMRECKEMILQIRAVPAVCFQEIDTPPMDVAEEPDFLG